MDAAGQQGAVRVLIGVPWVLLLRRAWRLLAALLTCASSKPLDQATGPSLSVLAAT